MAALAALALFISVTTSSAHAANDYVRIEGARFASVVPESPERKEVEVRAFELQRHPVTNAKFQVFVKAYPEWQRGRVAELFADSGYLRHWSSDSAYGRAAQADQPVINVSWFAATAYCEAQGTRLPRWHEWEWAAAADGQRVDARDDPAWRQRMLSWYAKTGGALASVAQEAPNLYGVHDLHGLVWEWVEDAGSMMVSNDNREQGDPDSLKFCGSGALSMEQKENYAVLMRIAMLSSLKARDTTANVGFRCARDVPQVSK